ncbi:MAG: reverse transcriptase, partial [Paramuribaculum sp.]|nr:reverse transcriptase [Paramuribaculum sp.]
LYYFRYMDDMVFLATTSEALHFVLDMVGLYLAAELKVEFKHTWQIFPVDDRSIDYVGFKQNHYGVLMRKSILLRFYKKSIKVARNNPIRDLTDIKHLFPSEYGWAMRCSEQHKTNIFNTVIRNGKKHFINRAAVADTPPSN